MTKEELLAYEESQIDRSNIESYKPLDLNELAEHFIPKYKKFVPKFVFKKLKKLLHIDELNQLFESTHYGTGQQFLDEGCDFLGLKTELNGPGLAELEKYKDQPVMFASNHPYGGPEGLAAFKYIHREFPRARILIQSFMKIIRPFTEISIYNGKDLSSLMDAVKNKRPLFFYPAGYCSRKLSNGEIFDYEWKNSFVRIAQKNNMPIVIMYTHGQLSKRTLRITQIRKFFHIKYSIETIYLPDEMFKMKDSTLKITYSHVIDPSVLTTDVSIGEWAARLRQYCYELKTNPDAVFDPKKPATLPLI